MFSRLFTIFVLAFWLVAMGWLVHHDIAPAWTAQDAPKFTPGDWLTERLARSQARIENKYGQRVGTVWTEFDSRLSGVSRTDLIVLDNVPSFGEFGLPQPLKIFIEADYTTDGELDTFRLQMLGYEKKIELLGERYSGYLAFRLDIGAEMQLFKVDASLAGMIADAFNPFPMLPAIEVGDSWRMHVVNPLAAITGVGQKLVPMLVTVTGKETIDTFRGELECFIVEAGGAKAWVDADGSVLQQEVDLPYGGRYTIIAEPYDENLRVNIDLHSTSSDTN